MLADLIEISCQNLPCRPGGANWLYADSVQVLNDAERGEQKLDSLGAEIAAKQLERIANIQDELERLYAELQSRSALTTTDAEFLRGLHELLMAHTAGAVFRLAAEIYTIAAAKTPRADQRAELFRLRASVEQIETVLSKKDESFTDYEKRCAQLEARLQDANQHFRLKVSEALRDDEAVAILGTLREAIKVDVKLLGFKEDMQKTAIALSKLAAAGLCEVSDTEVWITEQGLRILVES